MSTKSVSSSSKANSHQLLVFALIFLWSLAKSPLTKYPLTNNQTRWANENPIFDKYYLANLFCSKWAVFFFWCTSRDLQPLLRHVRYDMWPSFNSRFILSNMNNFLLNNIFRLPDKLRHNGPTSGKRRIKDERAVVKAFTTHMISSTEWIRVYSSRVVFRTTGHILLVSGGAYQWRLREKI